MVNILHDFFRNFQITNFLNDQFFFFTEQFELEYMYKRLVTNKVWGTNNGLKLVDG